MLTSNKHLHKKYLKQVDSLQGHCVFFVLDLLIQVINLELIVVLLIFYRYFGMEPELHII